MAAIFSTKEKEEDNMMELMGAAADYRSNAFLKDNEMAKTNARVATLMQLVHLADFEGDDPQGGHASEAEREALLGRLVLQARGGGGPPRAGGGARAARGRRQQ